MEQGIPTASYLAIGLDAVEENGGSLPCLGSKVVPCTLGEGLIVLPSGCGDVWEHSLATLLGVSQVGQDCGISVAAIGGPLLVEEIVPMCVVLQRGDVGVSVIRGTESMIRVC